MIVYLDNASTTKPCEAAVAASLDALTSRWGNPSSAHKVGQEAERAVKEARIAVAGAIGADAGQIFFTGGGTESDNLALGAVLRDPRRAAGAAVFISSIEHPAVSAPAARLAELGAALTAIPVDAQGAVSCAALERSLEEAIARGDARRAIVSVMHVNNEIGTIQPVADMARVRYRIAKKTGAEILLHTDAVQSYLKLPIDVGRAPGAASGVSGFAGVDLMSFSAHKAHGPKGIGALYASAPEKLVPLVRGGGQEGGARSGTENVPGILGFGAAVADCTADGAAGHLPGVGLSGAAGNAPDATRVAWRHSREVSEDKYGVRQAGARVTKLRDMLLRGIEDAIPDARINSPREASCDGEAGRCSPYILNVSFLGTRGEVVLRDLEQHGVFVSTGSACSNIGKGAKKMNPVLAAMGLTPDEAMGAVRFSLSKYNTEDEIDYAVEQVKAAVERFRRIGSLR